MINVYDGRGTNKPLHTLKFHSSPLTVIKVSTAQCRQGLVTGLKHKVLSLPQAWLKFQT